jgi:hypothetical protein
MAKAKKVRKVKKASGARKARSSRAAGGGKLVTAPIHSIVQFVRMLIDEGHDQDFEKLASDEAAVVAFDRKSTEFVKKFLASNRHLRPAMTRAVRDPCPGNPFEC